MITKQISSFDLIQISCPSDPNKCHDPKERGLIYTGKSGFCINSMMDSELASWRIFLSQM